MSVTVQVRGCLEKKWCAGGVVDNRKFRVLSKTHVNALDEWAAEASIALRYVWTGPFEGDSVGTLETVAYARGVLLDVTQRVNAAAQSDGEGKLLLLPLLVLGVGLARLDCSSPCDFQWPVEGAGPSLSPEQRAEQPAVLADLAETLRQLTAEIPAHLKRLQPFLPANAGQGSADVPAQERRALLRAAESILASKAAAELLLTWIADEEVRISNKVVKSLLRWVQSYPGDALETRVLSAYDAAADALPALVPQLAALPYTRHAMAFPGPHAPGLLYMLPFMLLLRFFITAMPAEVALRAGWQAAVRRLAEDEGDPSFCALDLATRAWCHGVDRSKAQGDPLLRAWLDTGWWARCTEYFAAPPPTNAQGDAAAVWAHLNPRVEVLAKAMPHWHDHPEALPTVGMFEGATAVLLELVEAIIATPGHCGVATAVFFKEWTPLLSTPQLHLAAHQAATQKGVELVERLLLALTRVLEHHLASAPDEWDSNRAVAALRALLIAQLCECTWVAGHTDPLHASVDTWWTCEDRHDLLCGMLPLVERLSARVLEMDHSLHSARSRGERTALFTSFQLVVILALSSAAEAATASRLVLSHLPGGLGMLLEALHAAQWRTPGFEEANRCAGAAGHSIEQARLLLRRDWSSLGVSLQAVPDLALNVLRACQPGYENPVPWDMNRKTPFPAAIGSVVGTLVQLLPQLREQPSSEWCCDCSECLHEVKLNLNVVLDRHKHGDEFFRLLAMVSTSSGPRLDEPELDELARSLKSAAWRPERAVLTWPGEVSKREQLLQKLSKRKAKKGQQAAADADAGVDVRRCEEAERVAQQLLEEEQAQAAATAAKAAKKAAKKRRKERKLQAAAEQDSCGAEAGDDSTQQHAAAEQPPQRAPHPLAPPEPSQTSMAAASSAVPPRNAVRVGSPNGVQPEQDAAWQMVSHSRGNPSASSPVPPRLSTRHQQHPRPAAAQPAAVSDDADEFDRLMAQMCLGSNAGAATSSAQGTAQPSAAQASTADRAPAASAPAAPPPAPAAAVAGAAGAAADAVPPALHRALQDLARELECPLGLETLEDPVTAADGHTYERRVIEASLAKHPGLSPLTGEALASTELHPSRLVRSIVQRLQQAAPQYFFHD